MEIVPGIHWIEGINGNCYLIVKDSELMLIDTGMPHNAKKILAYITNTLKLKPQDLKTIVITHHHIDHIGSALELRDATGAKIAAHKEDAEYIAGRKKMPKPKGGIGVLFKLLSPFMKVKKFEVDKILNDGDYINGYKVILVPGHTPGSIALYHPSRKILFPGDLLRFVDGKVQGPPEKFTPDMKLANQSIGILKSLDFDIMLCGHGEPVKSGASEMVKNLLTE